MGYRESNGNKSTVALEKKLSSGGSKK